MSIMRRSSGSAVSVCGAGRYNFSMSDSPTLSDQTLDRSDIAALAGREAHLINCHLDEADLKGLGLSGFVFARCSLAETRFVGATLEFARFDHCRGARADFSGTDCREASFADCDFNNASFRGATLTSTRFATSKLTGADFAEVHTFDIGFVDCLLVAARLPKANFRKEKLIGIDLSMADLSDCDFRDAVFERSSLREANIERANFQNADLRGADLGGLNLLKDRQRFRGAIISASQAELVLDEYGFRVRAK